MTVTILWWHVPTIVTVAWLIFLFFPLRNGDAWDEMAFGAVKVLACIPVLLAWIFAMAWKVAA